VSTNRGGPAVRQLVIPVERALPPQTRLQARLKYLEQTFGSRCRIYVKGSLNAALRFRQGIVILGASWRPRDQ